MKAPLRFAFGWVVYLAIFAATNPIIQAVWLVVRNQPVVVSLVATVIGVVLFIWCYFKVLRPFWGWCDAPRVPKQLSSNLDQAADLVEAGA